MTRRRPLLDDPREPQEIAEDPIVTQTLWLIRQGIPFDVAWSLPLNMAKAWAIILAGFEGKEYDWKDNEWKQT